jgi:energy-coupling factor transporter transmembrane protein EcfT
VALEDEGCDTPTEGIARIELALAIMVVAVVYRFLSSLKELSPRLKRAANIPGGRNTGINKHAYLYLICAVGQLP